MDRTQLLQHFETLAETPEALAKLRALVLDLAVRGRLVPQASKPGKDAAWQKFCQEVDDGIHNPESPLPFKIPEGWRWAVLEAIAEPCGQKKPNELFTYVDAGAIDNVRGLITPAVQVLNADEAPSRARKLVRLDSVIYSTVRPYLRNIAVISQKFDPPAIVSTAFAVLHPKPFLHSRFLFHWLRSVPFQEEVAAKMKGVAYPAISDSEFWQCQNPMPPPEEQRRIVAKVEELLVLCDELEARQSAASEHRTRLVRSALDHLTAGVRPSPVAATSARTSALESSKARHSHHAAAPEDGRTPGDFRRHADFVLKEFSHLTAIPQDVRAVRNAIISLGIQGHFTATWRETASINESAQELLDRILRSRAKTWNERRTRATGVKCREPVVYESINLPTIPGCWVWASADAVCSQITDGEHFKKQIHAIDRKMQGRIFVAVIELSADPITPKGDTVKRLTGDWKEFWRYRIGDFRLVYRPEPATHRVTLWTFAARGGVYD